MNEAASQAAARLVKNKDFRLVLDATLIEINELLLSLRPFENTEAVIEALTQYQAIREFGERVTEKANEHVDG